jgi:hypothetical protein
MVLFCWPVDRELLSILNSVVGGVSDGGPYLLVRVFRWREGAPKPPGATSRSGYRASASVSATISLAH